MRLIMWGAVSFVGETEHFIWGFPFVSSYSCLSNNLKTNSEGMSRTNVLRGGGGWGQWRSRQTASPGVSVKEGGEKDQAKASVRV